jgi:hypothetical protein
MKKKKTDWRDAVASRFSPGWPAWVSVDDGWKDIILRLIDNLDSIGIKWGFNQVKEKFGLLRAYGDPLGDATPEQCDRLYEFLDAAEEESATVCELCGAPGASTTGGGWIKTYCPKHTEKYEKQCKPKEEKDLD